MPIYRIEVTETGKYSYDIEADNRAEAFEKYLDGGNERVDRQIYDTQITDFYDLEEK